MKFLSAIIKMQERSAQRQLLRYLRYIPERQLVDMGFSVSKLNDGLDAYPWRDETESNDIGRVSLPPIRFDSVNPIAETKAKDETANETHQQPQAA